MSKSRNEKKPPVPSTVVPVSNDIIAGKFNENQWYLMIEQENTQEYICDILDDIIDCTIKVIYDKYIESQLKPYSVEEAKKLLLQIIETRFLAHDIGEEFPENDVTWQEDEEPTPCITDSWSQGSVPVQICSLRPLTAKPSEQQSGTNIGDISEEPSQTLSNNQSDVLIIDYCDNQEDLEIREMNNDIVRESTPNEVDALLNTSCIVPSPPTTPKINNNQESSLNKRQRKHTKSQDKKRKAERRCSPKLKLNENSNNGVMRDPSTSYSILPKVQSGRPPAEAEVTYDEHGNVLSMVKLSVDKLPTHRIRTKFNVCDPLLNAATLKSSHHKMTSKESVMNQLANNATKAGSIIKQRQDNWARTSQEIKQVESRRDLPPPLADSVNISAGVVIREGQIVRKGPDLYTGHSLRNESKDGHDVVMLKPVGSLATKQTISVSDVIGKTSPVVRQIRTSEPIPPIPAYRN